MGLRGEMLSAGQRQRIGLARAFFGEKRLIVLDEPNANLDPEGEEALAKAMENASAAGAVVIVITHRSGILRRMSHAGLMVDGRMVRFGAAKEVVSAANWQAGTAPDQKVTPLRQRAQTPIGANA